MSSSPTAPSRPAALSAVVALAWACAAGGVRAEPEPCSVASGPGLVACADWFADGSADLVEAPRCVHACDGKVSGVSAGLPPGREHEGATLLDGRGLWIVPGFVDLRSPAGPTAGANEESTEISPSLSALALVDPADPRFERALRAGVTTVAVSPGGRAVLGGTVDLLKTDARPLHERRLAAAVALSGTLGWEPCLGNRSSGWSTPQGYYYRRPNARMGLSAMLERAFLAAREGRVADERDARILEAAVAGELPVLLRARKSADVRAVLRLHDEFGLRPVLVEGTEAWRRPEELAARGVPVVLGPLYQQPRGGLEPWEGDDPRPALARILADAGVTIAFGSGPREAAGSLREWAILSVRHGLDEATALRAITSVPAALVGRADRIGRLVEGADADLLLLDAHPLDPTARVLVAVVEGRIAWAHPDAPPPITVPSATAASRLDGDLR